MQLGQISNAAHSLYLSGNNPVIGTVSSVAVEWLSWIPSCTPFHIRPKSEASFPLAFQSTILAHPHRLS